MKSKWQILAALAAAILFAASASADDRQTGGNSLRGAADHETSGGGASSDTGGGASSDSSSSSSSTTADSGARQLKDLLEEGFEIKSVNVIPADIVKAGGATSAVDAVMIVIERGPDLANCYVTFSGFVDGSYYNGTVPICTILK